MLCNLVPFFLKANYDPDPIPCSSILPNHTPIIATWPRETQVLEGVCSIPALALALASHILNADMIIKQT